jgi:hypothetical protein
MTGMVQDNEEANSRLPGPIARSHAIRAVQELTLFQETLNYWKQLSHVMKYFRPEEDPGARLPRNFVSGFLEGRN